MIHSHLSMGLNIAIKFLLIILFICQLTMRTGHYKINHIIISYMFQIIACLGIAKFLQVMYVLILNDIAGIIAKIL